MKHCKTCPCEVAERADAVIKELDRRGRELEKVKQMRVVLGLEPMGDCSDCQMRHIPCDMGCVW